ncbi:putative prefoldin subunit 6 [Phaeomoniella chlamydospora]|uniref:Putative prefoldin subunit 6 n=1 Tax=Phaeomoniella chlamydospora TaxID=158046 RepID=A0A0G2ELF6_PHACM|nr:putative prefoldin subunit 6 [Phaeomoniella chlamydospora]
MMAEEQQKLQALTEEYQKIQDDLQSTILARQKLESQQTENKSVKAEFTSLSTDSQIYKLIGPVLLKQEKNEAMMSVDGRLEFIEKEIKRIEGQIGDLQEQGEKKKLEVLKVQSGLQEQAAKAG